MIKRLALLTVLIAFVGFSVSCGSLIIFPQNDKHERHADKKNCKDSCKGLKGKERANCNKRCN